MLAVAPDTPPRSRLFFPESWTPLVRAAVLLGFAVLLAYHNAFSAPFVFEDLPGIVRNPTIRQLWPITDLMLPATIDRGVIAWPLVNFSFAVNYAVGGLDVAGYHGLNLLIHASAALMLFAVAHRTFASTPLQGRFGSHAFSLALEIALVWALHPLQTASVTSVIQRSELMAGLFLLLTVYAFIRASRPGERVGRWIALAVVSCLAGMATKAAMAVIPAVVVLYDRTFVSSTWRDVFHRHGKLHLSLALTWLIAIALLSRAEYRADFMIAGSGVPGVNRWLPQGQAGLKYLALAFWPKPLVFDYGVGVGLNVSGLVPQSIGLAILLAIAVWAFVRRSAAGFLGAWFILTLIPSAFASTEPALAEHRVYLPLVAVTTLIVTSAWLWMKRGGLFAIFGLAIVCGGLTVKRNFDYASALTLWRDTVSKVPENPRAHYNLANALVAAGRPADAVTHYETAIQLAPGYAAAHHNLGGALLQLNRAEEAAAHYRAALQHDPSSTDSRLNLAAALVRLGAVEEAVTHYEKAARSGLLAAEEQLRFGRALAEVGRIGEALVRVLEAARLNPNDAETRVITGMVLSAAGRTTEALQHFTAAVVADPNDASARAALGDLLLESSRPSEALVHYEAALKLRPAEAAVFHTSIGHALIRLARAEEAIVHYETALQLNPDNEDAQKSLKMVRAAVQRRGLLKH